MMSSNDPVQSKAYSQLIIANFTVYSPLYLLSVQVCTYVHPSSPDTPCMALVGGEDGLLTSAYTHLQPMHALNE